MSNDPPRFAAWLTIPAADYEGHMSEVGQLAVLGDVLAEAWARSRPARLLVVGCATGNGFEHVDGRVTDRVVGLDVNPRYLEIARERYGGTFSGLELVCADVEKHEFAPGSFDLIFAGLILEYVQADRLLNRMAGWLADEGLCCVVIQLPDERRAPVSETRYESLRGLAPMMRLLTATELERHAVEAGLLVVDRREILLPSGKRFLTTYLTHPC